MPQFFDTFFKDRPKKEFIALRAISGKTELEGSWYYKSIGECTAKAAQKKDVNVYFGVCTRSEPSPNLADVSTAYAIWVDLDLSSQNLLQKLKIFDDLEFIYEPSMVIDSGNGLHIYWLLNKPTNDLSLVEKTCRNMGLYCGGDEVFDRTRIMRMPGTLNVKNGPPGLLVDVVRENGKRYPVESLFSVSCIDPKIVARIISGSSQGFKSRSHRDWSVIVGLIKCGASDDLIIELFEKFSVGDKAQENATYLSHTLKKARQRYEDETDPSSSNKQINLFESECAWFIDKNDKKRQVSTYVFKPHTMVRGGEGEPDVFIGIICTQYGTEYKDVRLRRSDFLAGSAMAEAIPFMDCSWIGSDTDLKYLLPFLFEQFRDTGGIAKELRKQTGFYKNHWIGTHQILNEAGIVSEEDSLITYDARKDEGGNLNLLYDFSEDDPNQCQKFFDNIYRVNNIQTSATSVGWTVASMFKSRFEPLGYRFPFLNISGTRGAGKTTLIKEVLQPLVGYSKARTYDCSTTRFVLLSLLGSTTDVFLSLSEYRRSALSDTGERNLQRYLLLGYDEGVDPRGRANQTIKNYTISAPLTLDGEDMVADPALLERSIHVRMSPDDIVGDASDALDNLLQLNLGQIGSQLIKFSLSYPIKELMQNCEEFVQDVFGELSVVIPSRPAKNITTVLFGLWFLNDFAEYVECSTPKIDYKQLILDCLNLVIDISSGRTRRAVDDFIEDVVAEASRMLYDFGSTSFTFKYFDDTPTTPILRFHLTTAYSWWRKHRRQQGLPALEKISIEEQLKETAKSNSGRFVLGSERVMLEGIPTVCYGINLEEASKHLDVPSKISQKTFDNITPA